MIIIPAVSAVLASTHIERSCLESWVARRLDDPGKLKHLAEEYNCQAWMYPVLTGRVGIPNM